MYIWWRPDPLDPSGMKYDFGPNERENEPGQVRFLAGEQLQKRLGGMAQLGTRGVHQPNRTLDFELLHPHFAQQSVADLLLDAHAR